MITIPFATGRPRAGDLVASRIGPGVVTRVEDNTVEITYPGVPMPLVVTLTEETRRDLGSWMVDDVDEQTRRDLLLGGGQLRDLNT